MSKKDTKPTRAAKKKTLKPKTVSLRVGEWRNKIVGESFDKLNYLCEYYRRKPSEMVAILIDEQYSKIKPGV